MRIEQPRIRQYEGRHASTVRIDVDHKCKSLPEVLWFSLRGDSSFEYPDLSDAFLIGMLPVAMKLGEEIYVEGTVSERLAYGLQTYQLILNCWWPDVFKIIEIKYTELVDRRGESHPEGVGCCFSGGVDSFYTVLQHLPENQLLQGYQLTHALIINRFDKIVDQNRKLKISTQLYEIYRPILENWGLKLLMIDSNLKLFRQPFLDGTEAVRIYNSSLCANVHSIGNLFGRFLIPGHARYIYDDMEPWGSHPVVDHHMGTDQLQIIHHANGNVTRNNKLEFIADVTEVQNNLHSCFKNPIFDQETGGVLNCCKCNKCIRNLITLDLLSKLEYFKSFSLREDISSYKNPTQLSSQHCIFLNMNIEFARRVNNKEWIEILEEAYFIKKKREHTKQQSLKNKLIHNIKIKFNKLFSKS